MAPDANTGMTPIYLPQAGNTMEEGTILSWRVQEGETVKVGQVLFDLETDKATIEVEAEVAGKLAKIMLAEGETAPVKAIVAYIGEGEVPTEAATVAPEPTKDASTVEPVVHQPVTLPSATRVKASPAARKAAEVLGVDLESLPTGSGPGGRLLREDVEAAATSKPKPPLVLGESPKPASGGQRQRMSKMRRAIARNLAHSKQTLPHWYSRITIDAGPLLAHCKKEKANYPCSLNDVIVLACGRVMMEMPQFRSQIDGDDLVQFDRVNIGLAVAVEEGLVVPVVCGVEAMSLRGLSSETRRIVEAARNGKLEGVGEGLLTISNLGMYGVEEFAAIINPPEAAILAVGAVREEAVVKDGAIRPGHKMTMTLSADHRIIDGVVAAKFLARMKELLESPGSWS